MPASGRVTIVNVNPPLEAKLDASGYAVKRRLIMTSTKTVAPKAKAAPKAAATSKAKLPSKAVARAPVAKARTKKNQQPVSGPALNTEERNRLIAQAAYFRAEKRGFAPGFELQDWVEAETEVLRLIGSA
jgi:hypothetical protein